MQYESTGWHNPGVSSNDASGTLTVSRTLPPAPARLRGADLSREKLLQAAHELLLDNGGVEPSVSQICGRAGMQQGMVSYCFGGKAQLIDTLLERAAAEASHEMEGLLASDVSATEKLRRHIRGMIHNFVRFPYVQRLGEQVAADDARSKVWAETFAVPSLNLYRQLVAEGVAAGDFRSDVDADLLFFSAIGMCEFLFVAKSWLPLADETLDADLLDRFADHTVKLLLEGMGEPRPTSKPTPPSKRRK